MNNSNSKASIINKKVANMSNYILITPMKNEENNIQKVIESVEKQTKIPLLWIIVNDGSTDNSLEIARKCTRNYDWVHILNERLNEHYNWLGYSKVINCGVNYFNDVAKAKLEPDLGYIGVLDSDIAIDENYFCCLIKEMEKNSQIGVMSGSLNIISKNITKSRKSDFVIGGARLYRYEAFYKIGGFPNSPSPDAISDMKLKINNYIIKKTTAVNAYQFRGTYSREGIVKGFYNRGKGIKMLDFHPIFVFALLSKMAIKEKPIFLGSFCALCGYFYALVVKSPKYKDTDIRKYTKNFYRRQN